MGRRVVRCERCSKRLAPGNHFEDERTGSVYGPTCVGLVPVPSDSVKRQVPTALGSLMGDEW